MPGVVNCQPLGNTGESHQGELNSRPAAYKAAALPTELWWRAEPIAPFGKRVSGRVGALTKRRVSFLEIMEKPLFAPLGLRRVA